MTKIENYIFKLFDKNNLSYDPELIRYSIVIILRYSICILPALIIAIYFNVFNYFCLFTISFYILRIHFGGIHLKSHLLCTITSIVLLSTIPILSNWLEISKQSIIVIFLLMFFIYLMIDPQDNENKRNSIQSTKYHKKIGIFFLIVFFLIILYLKKEYAQIIMLSTLLELICILISYKKRYP